MEFQFDNYSRIVSHMFILFRISVHCQYGSWVIMRIMVLLVNRSGWNVVIGYGTTILLANAWLSLLPCDVFLPEMLSIFVSYGDEIFGHHLFDYVSI